MRIPHLFFALTLLLSVSVSFAGEASQKVALGKLIFNDSSLSTPAGQSCDSCHQAARFRAAPGEVVSPGANPALFGNRNAPSISYSKFTPELYWHEKEQHWVGGLFHDGRAKTLQDQAGGPFLNPLEMGNSTMTELLGKLKLAPYAVLFEQVYGKTIWSNEDQAFAAITDALVAYEQGPEFGLFNSKYDFYLQGKVTLTAQEKQGLEIFEAEDKGNCAACHPSQVGPQGEPPLLTDFTYDNLGLPAFPELPFHSMDKAFNPAGAAYVDLGLSLNPHIHTAADEQGKFKVPTLRNVAKTAPYMHNGMFATLDQVLDFYNTRDTKASWGKPQVAATVNSDELGDLKLTDAEIKALIAFMETLTDGYQP